MTVFAAGSNELMHLQFADGSHWLVNAGRSLPSDQAEWIVAPYLRSKGIKKLKGIVFTDYLKRHTSGFETLRRNFDFQYAAGPYLYKEDLRLPGPPLVQMCKGDRILIPDGSILEVLDHFQGRFVLGLSHGEHKFLIFPHDRPGLMEKLHAHPWTKDLDVVVTGDAAKEGAMIFKVQGSRLMTERFVKS
jgi:hypothetical protein